MLKNARVEYLAWAKVAQARGARISLLESGWEASLEALGVEPTSLLHPRPAQDRERIRTLLADRYGVGPGEVFPTLGTSLGLFLAAASVLEPGDVALVERPGYESFRKVSGTLGARTAFFERGWEDRFELSVERIRSAWVERTRLVMISDLHNPSGALLSEDTLIELADWCARHGSWLLVDEVYRDFRDGPPSSSRRVGENVLVTSSLTKVYGLGGLRAGWVLGPETTTRRLAAMTDVLHSVDPTPVLPLFRAGLENAETLRREGRARARRAHRALAAGGPGHPLDIFSSGRSLHAWGRLPHGWSGTGFAEQLLAEHGIAVVPGRFFGDDRGIRLSFGRDPDRLAEALDVMARVLDRKRPVPGGGG